LEQLETEHDNLRAALSWSLEKEPETALQLAATDQGDCYGELPRITSFFHALR
jgi:hypothetical protein